MAERGDNRLDQTMRNKSGRVDSAPLPSYAEEGLFRSATMMATDGCGRWDAEEQGSDNPVDVARRFMEEYAEVFEELAK